MTTGRHPARIGKWYLRWDKGEIFRVTGYNEKSRMIEIETYDGKPDGIDEETWDKLPLGLADPPEDWTGPVETVDVIDLEGAQAGNFSEDVAEARPESDPHST